MKRIYFIFLLLLTFCAKEPPVSPEAEAYYAILDMGRQKRIDFDRIMQLYKEYWQPRIMKAVYMSHRYIIQAVAAGRKGGDPQKHYERILSVFRETWLPAFGQACRELEKVSSDLQHEQIHNEIKLYADCLKPAFRDLGVWQGRGDTLVRNLDRVVASMAQRPLPETIREDMNAVLKETFVPCAFMFVDTMAAVDTTDSASVVRMNRKRDFLFNPLWQYIPRNGQRNELGGILWGPRSIFDRDRAKELISGFFPEYHLGKTDGAAAE